MTSCPNSKRSPLAPHIDKHNIKPGQRTDMPRLISPLLVDHGVRDGRQYNAAPPTRTTYPSSEDTRVAADNDVDNRPACGC